MVDTLKLDTPEGRGTIDGISLRPLLFGESQQQPERTLFAHVQRSFMPPKWNRSSVMTERWRLINGEQLYDSNLPGNFA